METNKKITLKNCRVIYPFKKDILLSNFIGEGSFASVYNYKDENLMCGEENSCALKFLKTEGTNKKTIEKEMKNIIMQIVLYKKMEAEIEKLKLTDVVPRIPKIYEIGVYETKDDKKEFYIIMENTGKSLEDYLRKKKEKKESFSLKQKLELFKQIAFNVKLMHNSGFIHRDLKPDNITVKNINREDVCYLIDFGFIGHKTISINHIESLGFKNIKKTLSEIYSTLELPHDEKFISFCELNENDSLLCFGYKGTVKYHPPEIVGKFLGEGKYFTKRFKKYSEVFPKIAEDCKNFEIENLGEEYDIYSLGVILLDILNNDEDKNVFNIKEDENFLKQQLNPVPDQGNKSRMIKIRNICRRKDDNLQDFLQDNLKILLNSKPNLLNLVKLILKNKASERIKIGPLCEKLQDIDSLLYSAAPKPEAIAANGGNSSSKKQKGGNKYKKKYNKKSKNNYKNNYKNKSKKKSKKKSNKYKKMKKNKKISKKK